MVYFSILMKEMVKILECDDTATFSSQALCFFQLHNHLKCKIRDLHFLENRIVNRRSLYFGVFLAPIELRECV